jgi:ADP-ribose pyrophosphatase YjhB (NUDIX family)
MTNEHTVLVWLLIEDGNSVLVAHRKADEPPFAGGWTLPGDVLPRGKNPEDLIAEYARDQLDVQIMGSEPFLTLHLSDGDKTYAIAVHRVGYEGTPRFRESGPYTQVGWAPRGDLMDARAYPYLAELAGHLTGTA